MITTDDANAIAKKLKAEIVSGRRHDIARIRIDGRNVIQFGIRRGSRRDLGHNFVAAQIHVSQNQAKALARCTISREEWIAILREKGLI